MISLKNALKVISVGLIAISGLTLACCSSSANNGGKTGGGAVPAVPVIVAEAVQKDMPVQIRTIGRVEAYSTVDVKAQVTGEITTVNFKDGQDVRQGDVLFTIDPRPYDIALKQAQALLEKDRALLKEAEADAIRYKDLAAKEYVTQQQFDGILANRDVLLAVIKGDEANVANARLQLERCTVQSPIDGRTGSLLIYRGNLIRSTDASPALVINQITPARVIVSVPEQNLPRIKDFMAKGELKVEALLEDGGAPDEGTLTFINNAIDQTTGTIALKATFANRDRRLWPGQFVNVVLTLTVQANAVVVPSQAVQSGQNGLYMFVVKDDMTVELRRPKIDRTVGGETVIAEGVKAGELQLVPGARVQVKPSK
jgi:membrane fusion protein, multidrug efflux system